MFTLGTRSMHLSPCERPAGNGQCTKPTCADAGRGVQEQHGARTNGRRSSAMMSELQAGTQEEGAVEKAGVGIQRREGQQGGELRGGTRRAG
ncbi:hypothetical protein NDU88_005665 [Pleurodeles waltl]|uniref:Uncharacterized protein n=1 Tax=Pleurodeles waltl TaxID=8319 RepID=A0AAV7RMQ5_PLEWA|nr:hypothetical protein NDU88_005665 [Pleurodeles waltl]